MGEKSAGVVLFREEDGKILYLVLKYGAGHWDLVKGHVESDESDEEAALRETQEETGIIDVQLVNGFQDAIHYEFEREGKKISKEVIFFLGVTGQKDVQLSHEHKDFKWLPLKDAVKQVTFKTAKDLLKKADEAISERMQSA